MAAAKQSSTKSAKKPKAHHSHALVFTIIADVLFVVSGLYAISTAGSAFVIFVTENGFTIPHGIPFTNLRYFPTLGLIPSLLAFLTVWFAYVGLRIHDRSRASYWLAVLSVVTLPLGATFVNRQFLIKPLTDLVKQGGQTLPTINFVSGQTANLKLSNFHVTDPNLILLSLALVLLMFNYVHFSKPMAPLSSKAHKMMALIIVLVFGPTIFLTVYSLKQAQNATLRYAEVASLVDYPLYRFSRLPAGFDYQTVFHRGYALANREDAVRISLSTPLPQVLAGQPRQRIDLLQVAVEPEVDLQATLDQQYTEEVMPIEMRRAKHGTGYLVMSEQKTANLIRVLYISPDDTLILLDGYGAERQVLLQLAESLEIGQ